jgi:outer membrane receptor protein involved in Fe transport
VDDTIVLSPTLVGSIRLSFLGYSTRSGTGGVGGDPKDLLTPEIITSNQSVRGWPTYNLGENIPTIGATLSFAREEMYSGISTWTKLTGAHSTKFGVDYRLNRINSVSPGSNASGAFSLSPAFTQSDPYTKSAGTTSGTSMATLLLGLADSGNFGYNSATSIQNSYTGLFVQDDWKISTRLTLNLGVRYELETPYTERYNRESYRFDPHAALPVQVPGLDLRGGILFAGVNGHPRAISPDTNNFGPASALPGARWRRLSSAADSAFSIPRWR